MTSIEAKPSQSNPPVSWRKIKALGRYERAIELELERDKVNQESVMQFFHDLRLYNLREAFMMAPECEKTFTLALSKFK
jgi:hypothetical protein